MSKLYQGGEAGVEHGGVWHPPDYGSLGPALPAHGDGEVVILGGLMTPKTLLGRHHEVVQEPREDVVRLNREGGQTHVEAVVLNLDDVGVDGVDHTPAVRVVHHVLPPHVGGEGAVEGAPEAPGLHVVTLAVPGGARAHQRTAAEQILYNEITLSFCKPRNASVPVEMFGIKATARVNSCNIVAPSTLLSD